MYEEGKKKEEKLTYSSLNSALPTPGRKKRERSLKGKSCL